METLSTETQHDITRGNILNLKSISGIGLRLAVLKLRLGETQCRTIEDYVDLAYSWNFLGRLRLGRNFQVKEEILQLLQLVSKIHPKRLLEIGTAAGGTLYLFTKIATPDALIISVDLPGGQYGGGYPASRVPFYMSFAKGRQRIELLRADSHDLQSLEHVRRVLGGEMIDFLFIDGDHSYEGVKKDFTLYSPLVRPGGMIAFHDIVPQSPDPSYGVSRFWNEMKSSYKYIQIIRQDNQNSFGIGVLFT